MKPPPDFHFHEDIQLLVWKPLDVVNEAIVNRALSFVVAMEARIGKPFHRFTDTSSQKAIELTFQYIFHVSLYRRLSYLGRPPIKSAFYATDPRVIQLIKIYALMTDHSPLEVSIFDKSGDAMDWLGISRTLVGASGW